MAVELFKAYGFQPKQYEQYMKGLREVKEEQKKEESLKVTERRVFMQPTSINPAEKLQIVLLVFLVAVITTVSVISTLNHFKLK